MIFALGLCVSPVLPLRAVIVDMILEGGRVAPSRVRAGRAVEGTGTFRTLMQSRALSAGAAAAVIAAFFTLAVRKAVAKPIGALILLPEAHPAFAAAAVVTTFLTLAVRNAGAKSAGAFFLGPGAFPTGSAAPVVAAILSQACRSACALAGQAKLPQSTRGVAAVGNILDEQAHPVLAVVGGALVVVVALIQGDVSVALVVALHHVPLQAGDAARGAQARRAAARVGLVEIQLVCVEHPGLNSQVRGAAQVICRRREVVGEIDPGGRRGAV